MDARPRRPQLAALSAVLIVTLAACSDSNGDTGFIPAPMPVPRTEVAGTEWHGGIAVAGGFTGDGSASAAAHFYDADANRWSALPDLPAAMHHSTMAALGDRVYVVGGYDAQSQPSAQVWSLGEGETVWRDEPLLPEARGAHSLVALNGRLIAAGGVTGGPTNTTVVFENGAWRRGPPLAKAREHLAAAGAGGRMYVIAGRVGTDNFTDVESWDGVGPSWRVEPALNHERGGTAAAAVGDQPCVTGGEELEPGGETIGSVECLRAGAWERVAELERPRHGLVVVALGDQLHVIGGGERPGLSVSGIHERFFVL